MTPENKGGSVFERHRIHEHGAGPRLSGMMMVQQDKMQLSQIGG